MLTIRCKLCNKELKSQPAQTKCCGCPNMATIRGETVTAINLSDVIIVQHHESPEVKRKTYLTADDLAFQEARKQRKVRRLEYEVR